ncbi:kinase-like protein, partial [Punctularia strigosozonata HHB-11173 SS5]|uniref:kinase-like protein n=1 Tax=Punctularia strigosozonata (strain HHB-11173) TaxID=741275 RepID=UPI0004417AD7
IVTPWMDNGNMSGFIKARILKLQDSIRLLYEVAQGLAYLHSQSIVHGDLRCSNVLIDAAEHAQLADFGLSLMSDGAEFSVSSTVGSLRWAAPELVQVQHITRNFATDVYAFGCTCLEVHAP